MHLAENGVFIPKSSLMISHCSLKSIWYTRYKVYVQTLKLHTKTAFYLWFAIKFMKAASADELSFYCV